MNDRLRKEALESYQSLVKGAPYIVLLVSSTVSVALSILGNGLLGILPQLLPLISLIGLYIARGSNRTGVRMVQICATILFWIHCILCSVMLITVFFAIVGLMSSTNDSHAAAGGFAGMVIAFVVILLGLFIPILYNRNIRLIMKDIAGWFVCSDHDHDDELPPESRHRVSCKLVLICVLLLILEGIGAIYLLSSFSGGLLTSSINSALLNGMTGNNAGTQLIGFLIPGSNIFSILAQAATIAKLISVILLYNQYKDKIIILQPKEEPKRTEPVENKPKPQPVPTERSVKIILERKGPKESRFSARMTSTSELIVGRKEGAANLVIKDDPTISGRHMRLMILNNKLYAEDLNSHNGIFVNGQRVQQRTQIHRGDEVRLGNSVFILKWET